MREKLYKLVNEGKLLGHELFKGVDLEKVLDERDTDPFDTIWVRVSEEVQSLDPSYSNKKSEGIRELAFKASYKNGGEGDIAAYISDDFGLIDDALRLGYNSPWLSGLFQCYVNNSVPCGTLNPQSKTLAELINETEL